MFRLSLFFTHWAITNTVSIIFFFYMFYQSKKQITCGYRDVFINKGLPFIHLSSKLF